MKLVLDVSVAAKWYLRDADIVKALKLRFDFHAGVHELLAPDIFPAECAGVLVRAERKGDLPAGDADLNLIDLMAVGIPAHPSFSLLRRAAEIALSNRLTVFSSLYLALAEREQCQFLTADQKLIRATRRQFSFVLPFAALS
ncbi:type II toxin-antitoxin system VapC family toxin [Zavarzinella formosa]|uniref:type II toxin-antitoxin system VapC family toxin n=1 Tax=Zavarzinella formosa TaxID=360055 RepID=UPI0002E874D9|nr:type II toxin-antitoxin system VapC family toxin [Zavarzinella formosa]